MDHSPYIGRWWKRLPEDRMECFLCPRHCQMTEGQRGFCFIRQATPKGVALTTYGRSSGYCIDPIEKKPLNHFFPGSSVLSFGTAGCNLGCRFCQNWDISKAREWDRIQEEATPEAIAAAAASRSIKSVAFTYNDPIIFAEYALDTAKACRALGIKTVAVTAGYITEEAREEFFDGMDAVNVDLKAFSESFYRKICLGDIEPVKDTLIYLAKQRQIWTEITTLLIPGKNDSSQEILAQSRWIVENLGDEIPLHFTAFHPDYKMTDIGPTPAETLGRARQIALTEGLKYVYTGNVIDPEGGSTWCPNCQKRVIERDRYQIGAYNINANGCCLYCGSQIPGRFANTKGSWGRRREVIQVSDAS